MCFLRLDLILKPEPEMNSNTIKKEQEELAAVKNKLGDEGVRI